MEHSTLEATPGDSNHEPPNGSFSDAPQQDQTREGLQPDWKQHGLYVDHSADAPESKELGGPPEVVEANRHRPNDSGTSRRKRWPIITLVLGAVVIALALSLGLGLGIGLKDRNKSTGAVAPEVLTVTASTTRTSSPTQSTGMPSSSAVPPGNHIRDDTSIAAVKFADESRWLFFQDNSGLIQQISYDANSSTWLPAAAIPLSFNAKNNTPMTAIVATDNPLSLHLFYVNTSNSIAVLKGPGYWSNITMQYDPNVNHPGLSPLAPNSKSLTAYRYSKFNESGLTALLLYEVLNGSVKLSYGEHVEASGGAGLSGEGCANGCPSAPENWQWRAGTWVEGAYGENISTPLDYTLDTYSAPFGLYPGFYQRGDIAAMFTYKNSSDFPFYEVAFNGTSTEWIPGYFDPDAPYGPQSGTDTKTDPVNLNASTIKASDLAVTNSWDRQNIYLVNGTQLVCPTCDADSIQQDPPGSSFPYRRLATLPGPKANTSFYLYNVIDGTTLGENYFDYKLNLWSRSKNISTGVD